MKVREFSKKYEIPQELVYEASFQLGDRHDFEPAEMAVEIRKLVDKRMKIHLARVERSKRILKNLEGV